MIKTMSSNKNLVLIATIMGSGIVFLDGSIVTLALPKIGANLHIGLSGLQWIVDGYALSLSALILLGGSLGDIFGRKKIYLIGLSGFGAASLLSGLAPNIGILVALRILQGIFGALLIPGGLAIINTSFSREERGEAIGKWAAWSGVFTAIGPLLGGYLLDIASWRWIFFINVPLAVICGMLALKSIDESRDGRVRSIDVPGAILVALSLAGITYGLIEGPSNKWQAASLFPLIIGFVLALIFLRFEAKSKDPMVRLSLFKIRNFLGSNVMTFAMYGALSGFMFALVIYLQTRLGYSSIKAGISLLPVTCMLLLFSGRVGRLSTKYGPRFFMTIGPLIASLAMISLVDLHSDDSYLFFLLPRVLLFGIGLVLLVAPLTTTVMTSVEDTSSGIASGINNAVSRAAGLIVIALLGLLGADNVFRFGVILCAGLAAFAGVLSFAIIQNEYQTAKVS